MKNFKILKGVLLILLLTLVFSGCAKKISFTKGDIKDDFCGPHINFQYCKCAFHGDYCDSIGMKKGEAKKYVNEKYDEWLDTSFDDFKNDCADDNGIIKGKSCVFCELDEVAVDDECVPANEGDESSYAEATEDREEGSFDSAQDRECKYDSDCDPICEGDVMWKMGCNPRKNECEKTFDTNCAGDIDAFGGLDFPKVCRDGACEQDSDTINSIKADLMQEKTVWSQAVKDINATRADINVAMLEANKNCINGIADMTNLAIVEFATRVASVLAGGIPDIAARTASAAEDAASLMQDNIESLAGAAVDYAGDSLQKLYNYQQGEPKEEERKLKPHEYIKLNCDLYEYFKGVEAESATELQTALDNANEVDELLKALP